MRRYHVRKGETLWNIWERDYKGKMGWSEFLNKFKELNSGRDPDKIYAGEVIYLPDVPSGILAKIASERPEMFMVGSFALGALFMVGVLWLTKKLKL